MLGLGISHGERWWLLQADETSWDWEFLMEVITKEDIPKENRVSEIENTTQEYCE